MKMGSAEHSVPVSTVLGSMAVDGGPIWPPATPLPSSELGMSAGKARAPKEAGKYQTQLEVKAPRHLWHLA